jgi:foldase protein PrsA
MNKDMKKKAIVLSMCVLLTAGCGAKTTPKLENGDEAITTLSDDRKISVDDLYNKMKDQYGLETLINMIDKMILEDKYADQMDAAKESAQSTIDQLKSSYGDKLLSAIQYYTSYKTVDDYQNYVYLSYLQNKAVNDYAKTKITDSEVKKYYKDSIKADIKISHILINVDVASDASDDDKTQAENDAKAKAEEVISKLKDSKNVSDTFTELAKEYSSDDSTKDDGGNLGYINTDTLGDDYANVVTAAYKLKDGEYTKEPVKTTLGYHVVLRTETKDKAALDDVKDSIISTLATQYVTNNKDATIKAMQELRKSYDMDIVDTDLHDDYVNYIQNSLEQIKEAANSSSSSSSTSSTTSSSSSAY